MLVKTSELTGAALNWLVAKCEGFKYVHASPAWKNKHGACGSAQVMVSNKKDECYDFAPSTNWAQGGPLIEREMITLRTNACVPGHWAAYIDFSSSSTAVKARQSGPTPLIAAMRCYCCAKLGGEIDIPQELQPCQQLNI
ncbi:MAG: DUF2591 domain-containing protein [Candidatus Saccharibacteria bacterium]|nr:DUF2591 domain-containing protein [Candidatus Saccharibacteria bacterium]